QPPLAYRHAWFSMWYAKSSGKFLIAEVRGGTGMEIKLQKPLPFEKAPTFGICSSICALAAPFATAPRMRPNRFVSMTHCERRPAIDEWLPVHGDVQVVRRQESARWATGKHRLHGPAARQPAAVDFDELAERHADRQLDDAGISNRRGQCEQHGPGVVGSPL